MMSTGIAAGEQKARETDSPNNVAVVDPGGNLVAHIRMDDARMGNIDTSVNKAFTARAFDTSNGDLAKNSQPGAALRHQRLQPRPSDDLRRGLPLSGTTGTSSAGSESRGPSEQDQIVAETAMAAF